MSDELKFNQLDYNNMIVVAFVGYSVRFESSGLC